MTSIVEDINDRHMRPWADACQRDGIANTPLNPFLDQVCTTKKLHTFSVCQNYLIFFIFQKIQKYKIQKIQNTKNTLLILTKIKLFGIK